MERAKNSNSSQKRQHQAPQHGYRGVELPRPALPDHCTTLLTDTDLEQTLAGLNQHGAYCFSRCCQGKPRSATAINLILLLLCVYTLKAKCSAEWSVVKHAKV